MLPVPSQNDKHTISKLQVDTLVNLRNARCYLFPYCNITKLVSARVGVFVLVVLRLMLDRRTSLGLHYLRSVRGSTLSRGRNTKLQYAESATFRNFWQKGRKICWLLAG